MHCLLTALGSYGDVHPMIGLGVALQNRGHEVELITNPHFEEEATNAGLTLAPIGTLQDYEELTQHPDLWKPRRGLEFVIRQGAMAVLEELYQVVSERVRPGETLVAAHGLDLASRVVAETHDVLVASVVYAPMAMWSDAAPPRLPIGLPPTITPRWLSGLQFKLSERFALNRIATQPLEGFRKSVGLSPLPGSYFDWYYGVAPPVCLFPEWFAENPGDWPRETVTTGFPLWTTQGGSLDPEHRAFLENGSPPIVFTPGSANRDAQDFFAVAIGVCQKLGRRGVLLTKYPEQVGGRLPNTVRYFGFAPLEQVLQKSAAFVHHGGIGSSAQGLAAGVPQLIRPQGFDQFDNALRLRRLGVAGEISQRRFSVKSAAAALKNLLESQQVRDACTRTATLCDRETTLSQACAELERRSAVSADDQ